MTRQKTQQTSFRLSAEGFRLLVALAAHYGLTQVGVLEVLLRQAGEREGLRRPPNVDTPAETRAADR